MLVCLYRCRSVIPFLERAAEQDMYRFYTSPKILEETSRNLTKIFEKKRNLDSNVADQKAKKKIDAIQKAFPESLVYPSDSLISTLENDSKDRHVLAAAIEAQEITLDAGFHRVILIVTHNLKDFPNDILAKHNVVAISPDDFLLKLVNIYDSSLLFSLLEQQAKDNEHRVMDLLERLEKGKVTKFVSKIIADYYCVEIIKDLKYILFKFGRQDHDNNKFLKGKNYELFLSHKTVTVSHYEEGTIIDGNCNSILRHNLSCQHLKKLQNFVSKGLIILSPYI